MFSYFFAENYVTCKVTAGGKTENLTATAKIIKPSVKVEIKNKVSEMGYGETVKLGTALVPTTSNDVVTWTSSDSKVASVDKNGKVKALKEGQVTITATTMSGKTDSLTFNVYGGPDATPTPKPTATPKPQKPAVSNTVYEQNFEKDTGAWMARGGELIIESGAASPAGGNYVLNTGRTSSWNGPAMDMTGVLKPGKEYKISAYVKQTSGDGEVIKFTWDKNGGSQYIGIGNVATKKGEWTLLEGTISVDKDTTSIVVYFEADTATLDFMVDGIKVVDPTASASTSSSVKHNFKDILSGATGYGYVPAENGNAVDVAIEGQYQEIYFHMPKSIKMDDYEKIVVKLKTASDKEADAVVIKVATTDAELNEWGNPTPAKEIWGFVSSTPTEIEFAASDFAGKEVDIISFMANTGATTVTVYDVTFVPKK